MTGFRKAGIEFRPGYRLDPDLSGLDVTNFSAKFKKLGDSGFTDVSADWREENAGLYTLPMTFPTVGQYLVIFENPTDGLPNIEANYVVNAADIDDVKVELDSMAVTLNDVQASVSDLDGQGLADVKSSLASITTLLNDTSDVEIVVGGDETANITTDATLTGDTSGATGVVSEVSYDGTNTNVVLHQVTGTFQVDETVNNGTDSTTGKIISTVLNAVNSVKEFVSAINDAISNGSSGLAALKGYTDDIENMLLGSEKLADGVTDNPFYDVSNPGVAKESTLTAALATLQTNISDARDNVKQALDAAKVAISDKVDAVKTVVDANEATLEDAGYGLSALKGLIDGVSADLASDTTTITDILNDSTDGLAAIKTTLMDKLNTMDTKLDNIGSATTAKFLV